MAYKLLIVEDESRLREIICDYFVAKGFIVFEACDGVDALEKLGEAVYDIVFLDIMLPHIDGFTICRSLRSKSNVPIVFLTARVLESDILYGYKLGADDYITKPFSLPVLYSKALSLINRSKGTAGSANYSFDGLSINTASQSVIVANQQIELAPKEYALLVYLVENKNVVLSREKILNAVWGYDYFGYDRAVDTHIKKLRIALNSQSWRVKTIIKSGYCFEGDNKLT